MNDYFKSWKILCELRTDQGRDRAEGGAKSSNKLRKFASPSKSCKGMSAEKSAYTDIAASTGMHGITICGRDFKRHP